MLTFGSLFSGIGGFDLGFQRAGMSCAWQVEIDAACQKVLAHHWPEVERFSDVKEVGKYNLAAVDLVAGGFPCQDLSVAGKRAGLAGERSGLWYEFHRIIAELRPRWVVIENVPGLLSSNGGRDFAIILRGLVELRYGVAWRILDAQYFGVAQRRRRVFVVGSLGDGRASQILFECDGGTWDTAPRRDAGQRIAATLTGRIEGGSNQWAPRSEADNLIAAPISAHHGRNDAESIYISDIAMPLAYGNTTDHQDESRQTYILEQNNMVSTPGMVSLRANPAQPLVAFIERSRADGRTLEYQDNLAYALTNPGSGGRTHSRQIAGGFGVRRLTPTECERLQGFQDGWTFGSDSQRYRQLGNAVCVNVVEWIGRRLIEARP